MRKLSFYPRLAARSIKSNRQFYLPYLLTVIGTCAAMYILYALYFDPGFDRLGEGTANGQVYTQMFMSIGIALVTLFCFIFLIYTNGFLMKRRQKELGLYSVLGMSKRNIAGIMVYESLYIGLTGIALGLALGILLHKLMTLLLHWLMRLPAAFGFEVQLHAVVNTALFFALMIALTLVFNLVRVGRMRPVELLHGGETGEKEPRVNWLVVIIGVVSLGIGYGIAVMVTDSMWAIALYFIAVFFVIIGTYCLFTSLSILALKALKKNKRYYYKSKHFITVSGMLYRMKRNGVGLANICIIATMVMVMISGTLSMYLGAGEMVELSAPTDIVMQARHYYSYTEGEDEETRVPMDTEKLNAYALSRYKELGCEPTGGYQVEYLQTSANILANGESEERVRQLLGSKVRGTAEFSQHGDFHFTPQRETGPRLEQIKRTRGGSTLTRTLREQSRLKMTLYSQPGSEDPEADLLEEASQLLKQSGKKVVLRGRSIVHTDRVSIRADCTRAVLSVIISIPMERGADYSTAIANEIGTALKAVARNRDKIRRLEPKQTHKDDKLPEKS